MGDHGLQLSFFNNAYADGHSSSFSRYSFTVATSGSTMTPIINATTLGYKGIAATFYTTGSGQVGTGLFSVLVFPSGSDSPVFTSNLSWSSTDTTSTLASRLAAQIGSCSGSGAAVGALADGPSIYLVSCQAGTSYIFEGSLDFSNGSAGFQITMTNTPASAELPSITFSGTEQGGQNGAFMAFISPGQPGPYQVSYAAGGPGPGRSEPNH